MSLDLISATFIEASKAQTTSQTHRHSRPAFRLPRSMMFLLLNVGAFEVLCHYEARAVIRAFELHFIHQCANDLESAASRAFCLADCNRGGRLSISPAKTFALV